MDLMPVLTVVYHPHPLRPASDRKALPVALRAGDTVRSIIQRVGLAGTPLDVGLNGRAVAPADWIVTPVTVSDMLVLRQGLAGETVGAWFAAQISAKTSISLATVATIASVTAFAVNSVIAFAISALANSLAQKRPGAAQADDAPTAYSIEGGSNAARNYEPLQLVLGEHRVFPDYAGRPFSEYVPDPTTATEVINNTPATEARLHPAFGFEGTPPHPISPWTLIASTGDVETGITDYYGDSAQRTYTSSSKGLQTMPHTFVVRHTAASDAVATYEDYLLLTAPVGGDGGGG